MPDIATWRSTAQGRQMQVAALVRDTAVRTQARTRAPTADKPPLRVRPQAPRGGPDASRQRTVDSVPQLCASRDWG
jgi:hypothetical protein